MIVNVMYFHVHALSYKHFRDIRTLSSHASINLVAADVSKVPDVCMSATLTVRITSCPEAQKPHALPICHVQMFGDPFLPATHPFFPLKPHSSCAFAPLHSSSSAMFWNVPSVFLRFRNVTNRRWAIVVFEWISSPGSGANNDAPGTQGASSLVEVTRSRSYGFQHGTNRTWHTVGFAVYP